MVGWVRVQAPARKAVGILAQSWARGEARQLYAGIGIGVGPAGECDRAEQAGRLERVLPGYRFQPLDALVPKGRLRVPRVAACLDAIRAGVLELA